MDPHPRLPPQVLNALATAILPGLALKIFVKLLPGLLALLNRRSGDGAEWSVSEHRGTVQRCAVTAGEIHKTE